MLIKSSVQHWIRGCALLCATLLSATAFAGIPEPGIVLRGKVFNSSDVQQLSGTLQWAFTPQGSDAPVVLTSRLGTFEGDGGFYSYQMIVPLETRVSGFPGNLNDYVTTASGSGRHPAGGRHV